MDLVRKAMLCILWIQCIQCLPLPDSEQEDSPIMRMVQEYVKNTGVLNTPSQNAPQIDFGKLAESAASFVSQSQVVNNAGTGTGGNGNAQTTVNIGQDGSVAVPFPQQQSNIYSPSGIKSTMGQILTNFGFGEDQSETVTDGLAQLARSLADGSTVREFTSLLKSDLQSSGMDEQSAGVLSNMADDLSNIFVQIFNPESGSSNDGGVVGGGGGGITNDDQPSGTDAEVLASEIRTLSSSPIFSTMFQMANSVANKQSTINSYSKAISQAYGLNSQQTEMLANSFQVAMSGMSTGAVTVDYIRAIINAFTDKLRSFGDNVPRQEMPSVIAACISAALELIFPNESSTEPMDDSFVETGGTIALAETLLASSGFLDLFKSSSSDPHAAADSYAQDLGKQYGLNNDQTRILSSAFARVAGALTEDSSFMDYTNAVGRVLQNTMQSFGFNLDQLNLPLAESAPQNGPGSQTTISGENSFSYNPSGVAADMRSKAMFYSDLVSSMYTQTAAKIIATSYARKITNALHLNGYQYNILENALHTAISGLGASGSFTKYAGEIERNTMESNGLRNLEDLLLEILNELGSFVLKLATSVS